MYWCGIIGILLGMSLNFITTGDARIDIWELWKISHTILVYSLGYLGHYLNSK